jgi:hypothetical protein
MGQGGCVCFGVAEALEGRHLDIIGPFGIVGAGAAVAEFDLGCGKVPVGRFDALGRIQGRRLGLGIIARRQVGALFCVEHGVAFEEEDFAFGFFALLVCRGAGNAASKHHQFPSLALSDVSSQFLGLAVGQP